MKWLRRVLLVLLVLLVGIGAYGVVLARRGFPQIAGEIGVPGLLDRVTVTRDVDGVAHIYAHTTRDLYLAQGYVEAQDRFWQMDFWRHIGAGRLSEMFGDSQLDTDKFLRSLGLVGLAETELATMSAEVRDILGWYAEGVNAYLEGKFGADVSLEYSILGLLNSQYEIEKWTPVNTLTWAKIMSWDLGGNMREEIARTVLSATLPIERVEQLFPAYPADHPAIVPADQRTLQDEVPERFPSGALNAVRSVQDAIWTLSGVTGGGFEGIGSNNWVIGGSRTATGSPILANDPHLSIQMPSIWYEIGLHCDGSPCTQDRVGFTFAGTPGIVIGHNEHIAWGLTNEAVDTQDLFIEKVNPDNPDQYEADGKWVEFETRIETIRVAGADPVTHVVRSTRHGVVISEIFLEDGELDGGDIDLPDPYVVALKWPTLEPSTLVEAILGINEATNYEEFREASAKWDIAPQNLVYADVDGNIAYQSTGRIPIRPGSDGRWPVAGWTSGVDWSGVVDFADMPSIYNPERDFIETANQPVTAVGQGPFDGLDAAYGYRASRIEEMIVSEERHDVRSSQAMQLDTRDGGAETLVPFLLALDETNTDSQELLEIIRKWGSGSNAFMATGDSQGAAVYQAIWKNLLALTFHDDLPEEYWPTGGSRWFRVVGNLLEDPDDPFWDKVTTAEVEDRDAILSESLTAARDELVDLLGGNPDGWNWGALHRATFENQTLGLSGIAPIEALFNRNAPPRLGGGDSLVNAVGFDASQSYRVDWVPSMRMVVDLADLSRSTGIHTTGQSGHAFNSHYNDMIEHWTDGRTLPLRWTKEQIAASTAATLTLIPLPD